MSSKLAGPTENDVRIARIQFTSRVVENIHTVAGMMMALVISQHDISRKEIESDISTSRGPTTTSLPFSSSSSSSSMGDESEPATKGDVQALSRKIDTVAAQLEKVLSLLSSSSPPSTVPLLSSATETYVSVVREIGDLDNIKDKKGGVDIVVEKSERLSSEIKKDDKRLSVDPEEGHFLETGGKQDFMLVNTTDTALAVKIKCSNNQQYRVMPVYLSIEKSQISTLSVTRLSGPAKNDKLVAAYCPMVDGVKDPKEAIAKHEAKGQKCQIIRIMLKVVNAEDFAVPDPSREAVS